MGGKEEMDVLLQTYITVSSFSFLTYYVALLEPQSLFFFGICYSCQPRSMAYPFGYVKCLRKTSLLVGR